MEMAETIQLVSKIMRGFPASWAVAGGWAIDLFLKKQTRQHADLEVALFRDDQALLHQQLPRWAFFKVDSGQLIEWLSADRLSLPIHEIHGRSTHGPPLSLEFLLNVRSGQDWAFRRDTRVTLPMDRAILVAAGGVPVLSPPVVLLYKAKGLRQRDWSDFHAARESLSPQDLQWLRQALSRCHPGHPWLPLMA